MALHLKDIGRRAELHGVSTQPDTRVSVPSRQRVPRLVARLYLTASPTLRARIVSCLVQPLGTLGLAAVAAGAFSNYLHTRAGRVIDEVGLMRAAEYSTEQVFELARFVEQASPESLMNIVSVLNDNPAGMAAFSASVAVLLLRLLRRRTSIRLGLVQEPLND